jgi:heme-degrading monooxygenase HmoA
MHAVVVRVTIKDEQAGEEMLHNEVVPAVKQVPGFVTGWWTRSQDRTNGMSLIVLESEEAAQAVKQRLESPEGPARTGFVEIQGIEVREVVANA